MKRWSATLCLLFCALALMAAAGCSDRGDPGDQGFLIRVGDRQLSVAAFNRIFEISKTAYSHNDLRDPVVNRDIKLRLLNQLVEELILIDKAQELDIAVSDAELSAAVDKITAAYPDGVFDEMLMESAVSYEVWQERLRMRLLTRKVIDKVIASEIVITPEDIQAYLEAHRQDWPEAETSEAIDRINAIVLRRLRESKTEQAYAVWVRDQRKRMPVEINAVQWERLMNKGG